MKRSEPFLSNESLERRAMDLLIAYQHKTQRPLRPPIVAEKVVQRVYDLNIVWEPVVRLPVVKFRTPLAVVVAPRLTPAELLIVRLL